MTPPWRWPARSTTRQAVEAIRKKYHLDQPLPVQYGIWIGNVLRGDFGESLRNKIPVSELLRSKLPVTVELALAPWRSRS